MGAPVGRGGRRRVFLPLSPNGEPKKKRENLRKISRLPPPAPCLGEKLLALRPQRVLPLYTAYLMNNHCVPPSALARPRTLLAVGGGEAAGLDSSKAHFIICGLNLAE